MTAPIDRIKWQEVPGQPGAFILIDKATAERFDVVGVIEEMFNAGHCRDKK